MKRVRRSGTTPELIVRRLLTALGARYRLNPRTLPGRPDLANQRRRKAVFVHGCFWHAHEACGRGRIPKANRGFWADKLEQNVERDARKIDQLRAVGFDVLVVWECELKDQNGVSDRLRRFWFDNDVTDVQPNGPPHVGVE
jgi:DNA mismatch endonuclease, patch repair protein